MTEAEFLSGYVPVWVEVQGKNIPVAFMKGTIARWVIKNPQQRLYYRDSIAKDANAWDERIYPYVSDVEVLDFVTANVYHILSMDFDNKKEQIIKGGGRQYLVDRKFWRAEPI